MRGILFRGKRIDNGEWVEGYYIGEQEMIGKKAHWILDINDYFKRFHYRSIDPDTIGQYTGLTANGKKIFEGDIVKVSSPAGSSYYAKIEYDCGCYWISNPDIQIPDTINNFDMEFVEVIGNIHDNFELFNNSELLEDKL